MGLGEKKGQWEHLCNESLEEKGADPETTADLRSN